MPAPLDRRSLLALTGTAALAVPTLSGIRTAHAEDVTPRPAVVVARGTGERRAFFADTVKLADGRLLVVYREALTHQGQDGRIMAVSSADGGRTWSQPRVAVDTDLDDRDPKLVQLRDGTLCLNFFRTDWTGYPDEPITLVGSFVSRSTDGGRTWSEPAQVGTAMRGPSDLTVLNGLYWAGHAATHGPIVELDDGELLVPIYGFLPTGGFGQASVVRSTDGGRSWSEATEAYFPHPGGFHLQEPNLTVLSPELIMCVLRTTANVAYLSYSTDRGRSWSRPVNTGVPASSHHQLLTGDGAVLFTYGDLSKQFGPGRPTVGRLVRHPEQGIDARTDVLLYDAAVNGPATADQANPSSVELEPGRYFTTTSDPHLRAIVGVYSARREYAAGRR